MTDLPEDVEHLLLHASLLTMKRLSKMKGFKYKKIRERKLELLKEHLYQHSARINKNIKGRGE